MRVGLNVLTLCLSGTALAQGQGQGRMDDSTLCENDVYKIDRYMAENRSMLTPRQWYDARARLDAASTLCIEDPRQATLALSDLRSSLGITPSDPQQADAPEPFDRRW